MKIINAVWAHCILAFKAQSKRRSIQFHALRLPGVVCGQLFKNSAVLLLNSHHRILYGKIVLLIDYIHL